ncbi:MAG: DUF2938 family protein [Ignavibacteriales bacterium]|nr:DUF2938 family protein [Ignavibacteriales bacterium]
MGQTNLFKAIIAGVAGTITMTMMTVVAPMMGMPEMNIPKMLGSFMGVPVIIGWFAHFMIGVVLAVGYAYVFYPKLSAAPWLKGLIFSIIPWLAAQVMVNPMMGAGLFAMNTPAPMMMVMGSLVGHTVYGITLGLVYGSEKRQKHLTANS